jgi:aminoglycoside 2''-phosphotransferase
MGYARLPGKPLSRGLLEGEAEAEKDVAWRLAGQLGAFLHTLHGVAPETLGVALPITNGRATWEGMYARIRQELYGYMRVEARAQAAAHFEGFLDDPANFGWSSALIHGDFGPGNILYDAHKRSISGIVDWSSAGLGDPATDLAALIAPYSFGERIVDLMAPAYPTWEAELPRSRFYTGTFALQEALFGLETGEAQAVEAGLAAYR